jgi:restriction endonuclease S subunit
LSDIFKIKKTKNINYDDLQSGNTPYVTRTTFNNGVEKKVDSMGFILNIGNSIIIGGESAMAFYQEEPFLTGNNITKLTCSELNKFTGIFICSVLNKEKYRYSYGRA